MKILLVEDTRAVAAVMAARLATFGYQVAIAENGQIAVDMFRNEPPDLILMDIEMPVMNGFEATTRIRALESEAAGAWTPIIFLTASDSDDNLIIAIDAGGDDFLSKTVPEAVLKAKMKALSRVAAMRQRLAVANRQLADMASRDGLTGISNRRHMDLLTDAAWATAIQKAQPFGLWMIDIDNFKRYNDHYGHPAGDDCLRRVAQALARVCAVSGNHETPILARYGGEEFAIVVPNISHSACKQLGERVAAEIHGQRMPHEKNAEWGIVTASLGGAWVASASGKIVDLFRQADAQLYRAKANGRNRYELL